jgi:hypothetical protein
MTLTADREKEQDIEKIDPEDREVTTDWANPPELADLKANYEDALSHHSTHVTNVSTWLDNLNVRNGAKPAKRKGRSQFVPKLIRKQAEWRYASLSEAFLSHEDLYTTEALTYEDGDTAYQNGLILNNQWNTQLDKVAFIDEYVRTGVDEGSIVVRVGWESLEEEIEVPNLVPTPITNDYLRSMVEEGSRLMMQDPKGAMENLPPELLEIIQMSMEAGEMVEPLPDPDEPTKKEIKVLRNQPSATVCEYATTIIDPTCKGVMDDAQFVVWEFETSLGQLRKEPNRYTNLDAIDVENNAIEGAETVGDGNEEDTGGFNFTDEPRKKFTAYEYWGYWDIDDTGIPQAFVSTWVGATMIRLQRSPFPDNKLPFILVQYLPVRQNIYGEPDGSLLEDNQKIAGAVTRGMLDIMGRSAAGQIGYRKDALDITNLRKFESGNDYSYNLNVDPRLAFHTHTYPEIPQSAPFMLEMMNNDAESLSGIKAFSNQGISGEGLGKSATAARSAIDAAGKRELGILRRLAGGIVEIGRRFTAMNALFLSEEEVVRVTNEEFITVNREDLDGRFNIKLKISTAEADDAKAQELAFMLQTVGNSMPPEFSYMIMEEISRLRKMPELAKRIETFEPQPDPMQQKLAELEVALKEAEIEKVRSEIAENYAEATLDNATAGKVTSEKDLKDLDFTEQADGTAQRRALEKDGAQARSNIDLEIVKGAISKSDSPAKSS